jgi:hypothetical protein
MYNKVRKIFRHETAVAAVWCRLNLAATERSPEGVIFHETK